MKTFQPNTERAAQIARLIRSNPARHQQRQWAPTEYDHIRPTVGEVKPWAFLPMPLTPADPERPICATAACVAGWAAILAAPEGAILTSSHICLPDNTRQFIDNYAQGVLGLNDRAAMYLFSPFRTEEQVLGGLDYLADHPNDASVEDLMRVSMVGARDG
jgi:hypothetical protein